MCKIIKKKNVIIIKENFYLLMKVFFYTYKYFILIILGLFLIKSNYIYL